MTISCGVFLFFLTIKEHSLRYINDVKIIRK